MVQQVLTNASREGARRAVLDGITSTDVQSAVAAYLTDSGISGASVAVVTNAAVAPDYAESVTVTVDVAFRDVSWLPSPMSLTKWVSNSVDLNTLNLSASTTMRRETVE